MDANQVVLLGTDFQYRLNGRPVTIHKRQGQLSGVLDKAAGTRAREKRKVES